MMLVAAPVSVARATSRTGCRGEGGTSRLSIKNLCLSLEGGTLCPTLEGGAARQARLGRPRQIAHRLFRVPGSGFRNRRWILQVIATHCRWILRVVVSDYQQ